MNANGRARELELSHPKIEPNLENKVDRSVSSHKAGADSI